MTTSPRILKFALVFLTLIAFHSAALGQSLYDVVISLSDRQRVVNQQLQVSTYLSNQNNNPAEADGEIPSDNPIDWMNVGTAPTQSALDDLAIGGKMAVLNQAVAEFDRLKLSFLNSSPDEFEAGSVVGTLRTHSSGNFAPLPRATPENYHELLRLLAQRLNALSLIFWPVTFHQKSLDDVTDVYEVLRYDADGNVWVEILDRDGEVVESFTWGTPSSIGPGNLVARTNDSHIVGSKLTSNVSCEGSYEQSTTGNVDKPLLREQVLRVRVDYPEKATVSTAAQGAEGVQIDGSVYILHRSDWHQMEVNGVFPQFDRDQGGYVVDGGASSGEVPLFSTAPTATFDGSWLKMDEYGDDNVQQFVEGGYKYKEDWVRPYSDPKHSDKFGNSYEQNWNVGCTFYAVFKPTFTRGVDATGMRKKLESAGGILADSAADGNLLLHPRPSLLFGIDLGPGLKGGGNGYISTKTMMVGWQDSYNWYVDLAGQVTMQRFDSSYLLQFSGSCSDYHVVYVNDRSDRTQKLPVDNMGWSYTGAFPGMAYDTSTLYRAWDSPRLKQVAGRDLVADITYNTNHYGGYSVKIYRRPSGNVLPTPGQELPVTGMTLIRTWTFSHPGGSEPHPTNAEKLEVVGSGGENYEIKANEILPGQGLGWAQAWYGSLEWWFWWREGIHSWTLKLSEGTGEKLKEEIEINLSTDESESVIWNTALRKSLDAQLISSLSSTTLNPFKDAFPTDWKITSAGKTITGSATLGNAQDRASRYGKLPASVTIEYDGIQPDADYAWDDNGLLSSHTQGPWSTIGVIDGSAYKQTQTFNENPYTTTWTEFLEGDIKVKTYTAPDGTVGSKTAPSVAWTEVEYGTASNGLPGLPCIARNSNGSGATYEWNANGDGSYILTLENGLLAGSSVSRGSRHIQNVNSRGYPTQSESFAIHGGTVKTEGTAFANMTVWGMPKKSTDYRTGLDSTWNCFQNLSRISTSTSALGLTSQISSYDVLGRPTTVSANGISAANTYNAFSISAAITGGATGSVAETRDTLGRLTSSSTTWNTVTDNLTVSPNASPVAISRTQTLFGTHQATLRRDDGTVAAASGATLPFAGTEGTNLSIEDGLLKTKTEIAGQSAAYQTTWTDAWGRVCKTQTPSGITDFNYSDSSFSLKRVRVTDPAGRNTITESDPYNTTGAITRSGIDVNGNGELGATDRYVESVATVFEGKIRTILKTTDEPGPGVINGLREILRTEWNPANNQTVTTINGNEESITRTPDHTAKTVNTESKNSNGSTRWTKDESFNKLGLTTNSTLTGTGLPAATLTPTWRADGSLSGVTFTAGGDTHSATFNDNGTLATLTAPGKGNILGGHSISGGVETLTVDGLTTVRKLDGTRVETNGGDVIGKTEELTTSGSGFKSTTSPTAGAATEVFLNAAGAPTAKNYAAGAGEARDYYVGGLLKEIILARGGKLTFGYSADGAKDLTSANWPVATSGPFSIPAIIQGYGYDRAGRIDEIGDSSGVRGIIYQKGRPATTTWTSGPLGSYQVVTARDAQGTNTGFTAKRSGLSIHSAAIVPLDDSGETLSITSGTFTASYGRDAGRNITSITRGSVIQNWPRIGGRISAATSNVAGAPTFSYTEFDAQGRRKNCTTAGDEWAYTYSYGSLTSATHPSLGSFSYQFDGIGRRTENSANTSDLLNRTLAWTNNQNKSLKVVAHPDARVWVGIGTATPAEIPSFAGAYSYPITLPPNTASGWVAWNTLAVLEGEGDAGANPDAKAQQSGAVWVPPINESFEYDAAGNRESSALWNYGWDARNNLARSRTKDYGTAVHGIDVTNAYDAENRRFSKKVKRYQNGQIVEQKHITFLHDGNDLIYERHQLPSGLTLLERKYVWGPDISGTQGGAGGAGGLLLIRETKGNATIDLYPLYDGSGNIVALADSAGVLQAEYAYGPFGELIHAKGPHAQSNPFRYATKYFDQETGLYNFGKRFLDPITGQFLSREPLGESESLNLYSYCHNDPVNNVDVKGLEARPVDAAIHNGIPTMIYEEWAGSGLSYLWNAMAAGNVKTWPQAPNDGQLSRCFYQENGVWKMRSPEARRNLYMDEALAAIPAEMEMIGPYLDAAPVAAVALPLVALAAAETAPVWIPALYSSAYTVSTNPLAYAAASGAATSGLLLLDGESPENAIAAGVLDGGMTRVSAGPINWNAMRPANWMPQNLFPSYGGRPGFAPGMVINPFGQPAPRPKGTYSVAIEVQLAPNQFGMRRDKHFAIANQALRSELATNPTLANLVPYPEVLGRAPKGWTWQHATTNQAWNNVTGQGRSGVLQLVPKDQHTGGSEWWRLLHPLPNGGGGYSEWAIPAGAPKNY